MESDCEGFSLPWFALYVKHKHEKQVCRLLGGKEVTAFVPTWQKTHKNGGRFELPLFPGYVFCRLDFSKPLPVISTPGVFRIVSNSSGGDSIPEEEIDAIKQLTASGLPVQPVSYPLSGQEVYLKNGPFRGIRGVVVTSSDQRWLTVSVHLLQRSIAVKLDWQAVAAWS